MVIPLTIISICYWKIYREVRRNRVRLILQINNGRNLASDKLANRKRIQSILARSNAMKQFSRKREIYLAKTLFIILLTFTLSFLPYSIIAVVAFFHISPYQIRIHLVLLYVTSLGNLQILISLSSAILKLGNG